MLPLLRTHFRRFSCGIRLRCSVHGGQLPKALCRTHFENFDGESGPVQEPASSEQSGAASYPDWQSDGSTEIHGSREGGTLR